MREVWRKVDIISADCLGEQGGGRNVWNIKFLHIPYPLFACTCWASTSWWDGGCSLGRLRGEGWSSQQQIEHSFWFDSNTSVSKARCAPQWERSYFLRSLTRFCQHLSNDNFMKIKKPNPPDYCVYKLSNRNRPTTTNWTPRTQKSQGSTEERHARFYQTNWANINL